MVLVFVKQSNEMSHSADPLFREVRPGKPIMQIIPWSQAGNHAQQRARVCKFQYDDRD